MLNSDTNKSPRSFVATPCGETTVPGRRLIGLELVAANSRLGVGSEPGHHLAGFVENRDLTLQFPNNGIVAGYRDGRRQQQILGHDSDQIAGERKVNDAIVRAVAGDDASRLKARVDGELVKRAEGVRLFLAAERVQVFACPVEAMNVVAGIAIGHVEVAVRRDIHAGQQDAKLAGPCVSNFEFIGYRGRRNSQDHLAFERHFDDRLAAQRRSEDELAIRLSADDEAVEVGRCIGHVAQEPPVGCVDLQPRLRILHADIHVTR